MQLYLVMCAFRRHRVVVRRRVVSRTKQRARRGPSRVVRDRSRSNDARSRTPSRASHEIVYQSIHLASSSSSSSSRPIVATAPTRTPFAPAPSLHRSTDGAMSGTRSRRSNGRSTVATIVRDDSDDDAPVMPAPQPLRRTRSQTGSLPAARSTHAAPAHSDGESTNGDDDVDTPLRTPLKKRSSRSTVSITPPSPNSPSLRARTSQAIDAMKQSCTRYQLLAFDHIPEWSGEKERQEITECEQATP
jgi:hypothetical protein